MTLLLSLPCSPLSLQTQPHITISFSLLLSSLHCPFLKDFIYLLLEREKRRKKRRETWSVASPTCPDRGSDSQPRHVPWQGTKPVTFCFASCHPTNWATLVRVLHCLFSPNPLFSSCPFSFLIIWRENKHEGNTLLLWMGIGRLGTAESKLRGRLVFQLYWHISLYIIPGFSKHWDPLQR